MAKSFVDLGHGGNDSGAVGNNLKEKDIVLAVGMRVKYHLTRHGVEVMLSRSGDSTLSLQQRTDMANKWGADSFLSIHCNSATATEAYGIETFCYKFAYRKMADCVHNKLLEDKSLYYTNRGVKEGNFHVIRESNMSACLVEMAFISNERDSQLLRSRQEQYAIAMTKGILAYHGIAWKDEVTSQPSGEMYRIRKSWSDVSSQIGAYSVLENAIKNCPKGYSVFDSKGISVYSNANISTPPPTPTKPKIDVFYRVAVNGKGSTYYSWVKNLTDYAGDTKNACCLFATYPSKGELRFRVSPINETRYYPEVQNYYTASGNYDKAGVPNVAFDKIQIRFNQSGYKVRYRVMCNGRWLGWVENGSSYLEGSNGYAGLGDGTPITAIQCEII